jgi:hypothetical protein
MKKFNIGDNESYPFFYYICKTNNDNLITMTTTDITTEKRIWEETLNSLFKEIRFKTVGSAIYVFNGKSLRRTIRTKPNSREISLPNVIMKYYNFGKFLEVRFEIYNQFVDLLPQLESNKLFLSFFKEWFENKFNITPNNVYVDNKKIMDSLI